LQKLAAREDPFANWSGHGKHIQGINVSEASLVPQRLIFKARRYKYSVIRWKSYVLTQKTVRLDSRWTWSDAYREVESLELLQHSHILTVVGSYSFRNKLALVLYPAARWTLEQFLELVETDAEIQDSAGSIIPSEGERQIGRFFTCMASAVDHIHATGFRHGSIRPRAWLVSTTMNRDQAFSIHLTGFDLAHKLRFEDQGDDVPISNPIAVTPTIPTRSIVSAGRGKYAAPEEDADRASDIFSLGCSYVEMMAALPSLKQPEQRSMLKHILTNDASNYNSYRTRTDDIVDFTRSLCSDIIKSDHGIWQLNPASQGGSPLQSVVEKMLNVVPSERPTASEVVVTLGGPYSCCTNGELRFEPDWLSENRWERDSILHGAEAADASD
jgi:serine/threonine protein kinase